MNDQGSGFGAGGGQPAGGFGGAPPPPGGFGYGGGGMAPGPMGPMGSPPSQALAVGALVTGALAFPGACCCYSSIPLGLCAIVMGAVAMKKAKTEPHAYGGHQMAMAGLIVGAAAMVLTMAMFFFGAGIQIIESLRHSSTQMVKGALGW